jgi:flagellar basal-body rod modification protein FlgD
LRTHRYLYAEWDDQDPLKPNDTQQVLEQLSSLRNIESQMQLQDQLEALVMQNELAQAGGMIGKMVQGLDESDSQVSGVVTAVRVVDGKAVLELDTGKQLPLARVTRITAANPSTEGSKTTGAAPLIA